MKSMQDAIAKTKRMIVDLFDENEIPAGLGGNAMSELFVQMAVSEGISRKLFLKTLGALYDNMSGKGGRNVKKKRPN